MINVHDVQNLKATLKVLCAQGTQMAAYGWKVRRLRGEVIQG